MNERRVAAEESRTLHGDNLVILFNLLCGSTPGRTHYHEAVARMRQQSRPQLLGAA